MQAKQVTGSLEFGNVSAVTDFSGNGPGGLRPENCLRISRRLAFEPRAFQFERDAQGLEQPAMRGQSASGRRLVILKPKQ